MKTKIALTIFLVNAGFSQPSIAVLWKSDLPIDRSPKASSSWITLESAAASQGKAVITKEEVALIQRMIFASDIAQSIPAVYVSQAGMLRAQADKIEKDAREKVLLVEMLTRINAQLEEHGAAQPKP